MKKKFDFKKNISRNREIEALDIVDSAWLISSSAQRKKLAKQALEIDPDCAEAYYLLSQEYRSVRNQGMYYRQGIDAFIRKFGKEYIKEKKGHFWGIFKTRIYMRLSAGYADLLWETGKTEEAIEKYEELLELNPNDNQGLRYILVNCYLENDDLNKAEKLLKEYDEGSAFMVYSELLLSIKKKQDMSKIRKKYKEALESNSHVPDYFLGKKEFPEYLPDHYGLGDDNEAVCYCDLSFYSWTEDPAALKILEILHAGKV